MQTTEEAVQAEKSAMLTASEAVWIATALLHRDLPDAEGFSREQIVEEVRSKKLTEASDRTVWQHVDQHCVADRDPNPGRTRMLTQTGRGLRRLYRPSDPTHPKRATAPFHPDWRTLPLKYAGLEQWHKEWLNEGEDLLISMFGSAPGMWGGADAVEYINRMREGLE